MCGIAEQQDTSVPVGRQRRSKFVDRESMDRIRTCRVEQLRNRRVPATEQSLDHGELVLDRLVLRHGRDSEPVDTIVGEWSDPESSPGSPRLASLTAQVNGCVGDSAPGRVSGVANAGIAGPAGPDTAAQSVGGYHEIEMLSGGLPVRPTGAEVAVRRDGDDFCAEAHAPGLQRGEQ